MVALPTFSSSVFLIEPRVYLATRENVRLQEITPWVLDVTVDSDIDRTGPKSQITISASTPNALPPSWWVAPYLDIYRENGDVESSQMGLYRLEQPEIINDGIQSSVANATGWDIIRIMEQSVTTQAWITPKNGHIMTDIKWAIRLSTCSMQSISMLNPSFELSDSSVNGWSAPSGSVPISWSIEDGSGAYAPAHGEHALRIAFPSNSPVGWAASTSFFNIIPDGVTKMYAHAMVYSSHENAQGYVELKFYDGSLGDLHPNAYTSEGQEVNINGQWVRHIVIADVPDNAVWYSVAIVASKKLASASSMAVLFDDAQAGWVKGEPLTRELLPESTAVASTPIAHRAGTKWMTRINDLAAAIGHHAIKATNDGRPTTMMMRDIRDGEPARVYTDGLDAKVISPVSVKRSTTGVRNISVAVKEDYESGTAIFAVARNDDPDHPWSTVNIGEVAGEPIVSSDAVDLFALQVLADNDLARASMQEDVSFAVLPDPTLTVHDIIEFSDPGNPESGEWGIESISWGSSYKSPLVTIGARRSIGRRSS